MKTLTQRKKKIVMGTMIAFIFLIAIGIDNDIVTFASVASMFIAFGFLTD